MSTESDTGWSKTVAALSQIAEWAHEGQNQTHAGLHSLLAEIEALARSVAPEVLQCSAPSESDTIRRADAIRILQDARERGNFDLRGLIAEVKGLAATPADTEELVRLREAAGQFRSARLITAQ